MMDAAEYNDLNDLEERLHKRLVNEAAWDLNAMGYGREREMRERLAGFLAEEHRMMSAEAKERLIQRVIDHASGLGPIEKYVRNPLVSEIMVNGPKSIWVQFRGDELATLVSEDNPYDTFRDDEHVRHVIDQIVGRANASINQAQPMVDTRLADGSRVNAVLPPISLNGPILTIRRFDDRAWTIQELVKVGALPLTIGKFLDTCVRGHISMLVSGGTNAGKTTTLNALSGCIPERERIVTIEDTAELQLNHKNVIRLETRLAGAEGTGEITIRDLVRNALRMRPERIIVGECRGAEALDMLQAMNTGHEGSMTTLHANSPQDAISRLETMVLMATSVNLPLDAVRDQIRGSLRLVLQQQLMADGKRRIIAISEVPRTRQGSQQAGQDAPVILRDLYRFTRTPTRDQAVVEGYWECVNTPQTLDGIFKDRNVLLDPQLITPGRIIQ